MYVDRSLRLFQSGDLRSSLDHCLRELGAAVESFDRNRLLSASVDELTSYFVSQYQLEAPRLRRDDAELEHQEAEIDPARFGPNPNVWGPCALPWRLLTGGERSAPQDTAEHTGIQRDETLKCRKP